MSSERRDKQSSLPLNADQIGRVYSSLVDEFVRESSDRDAETWAKVCKSISQGAGQPGLARVSLSPRKRRRWPAALLAAATLLAGSWAVSSFDWSRHEQRLSYVVEGRDVTATHGAGSTGERLIVSQAEAVELRFSDASVIRLEPHSALGVSIREDGSVSARLKQGRLEADVEHQEATDYRFLAGSYEVQVVGTSFLLGFQEQEKRFDLIMTEGKVVVAEESGKLHVVVAGQELHFDSVPELEKQESLSAVATTQPESEPTPPVVVASATPLTPLPVPVDFRTLAREGRFQEIVAQSRTVGLERILVERPAADLQELAQAARYTGEFALAERVWLKMRTRFSGGASGSNAVFFLGRLAEQRGHLSQAIDYYDQYLRSGTSLYAAEALGRKLQLVRRSRGDGAARDVALQYLKRFPGGAYASVAQELSTSK